MSEGTAFYGYLYFTRSVMRQASGTLKPARDDARYQGKVAVWYPLHPHYGKQELSALRRLGSGDTEYVEIHSSLGRQFVPAWMLDADAQDRMVLGIQGAFNELELSMILDRMQQSLSVPLACLIGGRVQ